MIDQTGVLFQVTQYGILGICMPFSTQYNIVNTFYTIAFI